MIPILMITEQDIIDAYGETHDISGLFMMFDSSDLIDVIKEAAWRDIKLSSMGGDIMDWTKRVFVWKIDPNFDFNKIVERAKELRIEKENGSIIVEILH